MTQFFRGAALRFVASDFLKFNSVDDLPFVVLWSPASQANRRPPLIYGTSSCRESKQSKN